MRFAKKKELIKSIKNNDTFFVNKEYTKNHYDKEFFIENNKITIHADISNIFPEDSSLNITINKENETINNTFSGTYNSDNNLDNYYESIEEKININNNDDIINYYEKGYYVNGKIKKQYVMNLVKAKLFRYSSSWKKQLDIRLDNDYIVQLIVSNDGKYELNLILPGINFLEDQLNINKKKIDVKLSLINIILKKNYTSITDEEFDEKMRKYIVPFVINKTIKEYNDFLSLDIKAYLKDKRLSSKEVFDYINKNTLRKDL